jgi:heme-degrading monooxygenase HmoA
MKFKPDKEAEFMDIFNQVKRNVRSQKGCKGLEILSSESEGEKSIWTLSLWRTVEDLETYRQSDLFKETWASIKPLFASKAKAWTLTTLLELP